MWITHVTKSEKPFFFSLVNWIVTQEQNHDAIILTIPDSKRVHFAGSFGEYGSTMILEGKYM